MRKSEDSGKEALREATVWIEETGTQETVEEGVRRDGVKEVGESGAQRSQDKASGNERNTGAGGNKRKIVVTQGEYAVKRKRMRGGEGATENSGERGERSNGRVFGEGNSQPVIGNGRQKWAKNWRRS